MLPPLTLRLTLKPIFSPASVDGLTLSDSQGGPTTAPSGPAPARASLSARQAKALGLLTSGTYGPRGIGSSASAALSEFLGNRLQTLSGGSTLFRQTWKQKVTPSGRPLWAHTASAHRTSGSDCTGWATPTARDWRDGKAKLRFTNPTKSHLGRQAWYFATETESRESLNPAHTRWLMGYPTGWDSCGATAMQSCLKSRKRSS